MERGDLVAFRYNGGWEQLPVQVDERAVIDFDDVYNSTDAGTFTGPDGSTDIEGAFVANHGGPVRAIRS